MSWSPKGSKITFSCSPKEDYDPLVDDEHYTAGLDLDQEESEEADSLCNSLGLDAETPDTYSYGITPPTNTRAMKRAKEKARSQKFSSKNEMREIVSAIRENSSRSPNRQGPSRVAINEPGGDNADSDSDPVNLKAALSSGKKKKQLISKSYKMTRGHDRDFKQMSSADLQSSFPKSTFNTPNHFKSLESAKQVVSNSVVTPPTITSGSLQGLLSLQQKHQYGGQPFSKERLEFHKTFTMLIRMGNRAMKEKENKFNRQLSYEQEEWQTAFSDIIWLELRAYLSGRKREEQDELQYKLQQEVPTVLDNILNFKVRLKVRKLFRSRSSQGFDNKEDVIHEEGGESFEAVDDKKDSESEGVFSVFIDADPCSNICDNNREFNPSRTSVVSPSLSDILDEHKEALLQVVELLNQLEYVEALYPTYKALGMAHTLYDKPSIQYRLRSLYLWLNITIEMGNKLHDMARMLRVGNLKVEWPWLESNPRQFLHDECKHVVSSGPQIYITQPSQGDSEESSEDDSEGSWEEGSEYTDEEDDEEEGKENTDEDRLKLPNKNVRFDLSDSNSSAPGSPVTEGGTGSESNMFPPPSDSSTPSKPDPPSRSASFLSVSRSSSTISFEESTRSTIYRDYADRMLKRTGVTKLQKRLKDLLEGTLQRARTALERPKGIPSYASVASLEKSASEVTILSSSPSMDGLQRHISSAPQDISDVTSSLASHGFWSPEFQEMALPSFKPTYLFLVRIPLDVIHECLRLRLEQKPKKDPSSYSIRHLIKECKEVLEAATNMKAYYQQMVSAVMPDQDPENCDFDLDQFEDAQENMFDVYLDYLRLYMADLQQRNMSAISKHLKNFLEEEWRFAKEVTPHIRGGEANAGKRFCIMATSLLQSISIFLDTGMDEIIYHLYDLSTTAELESGDDALESGGSSHSDDEDTKSTGESVHSTAHSESSEKAPQSQRNSSIKEEDSDLDEPDAEVRGFSLSAKRNSRSLEVRKGMVQTCRDIKELFNEARERVAKALNFAKMLRKDLEIAAEYSIADGAKDLQSRLKITRHIRVLAPHTEGYLMLIPHTIVGDNPQILHLLNTTCGREDLVPDPKSRNQPQGKTEEGTANESPTKSYPEGYMLVIRCGSCTDPENMCGGWDGETLNVESSAELTIALSHMEVESLLLVVLHSSQLEEQRKNFESCVGQSVQLVSEQISCHTVIAESLQELKKEVVILRDKVDYALRQVEEKLSLDDITDMEDTEKVPLMTLCRETLLRCYNFSCEYHEEMMRLVSFEMREALYPLLVDLSKRWMIFATKKCEKGRGRRPKWAHIGLNFLTVAIHPLSMARMEEKEFQEIKAMINSCIHHVIGEKTSLLGSNASFRVSSPDITSQRHAYNRIHSCPESSSHTPVRSQSNRSIASDPPTPHAPGSTSEAAFRKHNSLIEGVIDGAEVDREQSAITSPDLRTGNPFDTNAVHKAEVEFPRLSKMWVAVYNLEKSRNKHLREKKLIGHRTKKDKEVDMSSLVNVRPVKFRWQRTTKIGEGRFGKVYNAVNTNNGELMAMKEIKFQTNDIQYIRKIIDEIKNLDIISGHESLVQYHGVEVHSDEIYIFMEYCTEGTLSDAAKQGLTEDMTRKYTKEILDAVTVLHEHNIVHRDIKGANIFLTSTGPLKLGDFGCAVQLKSHNTMPGEVKGMEGTTAYMAPEVFTNQEYGRAADIWSVGCVVIEMATGKRPWPELESQFQIMYRVGMGESPAIPASLSDEGQDFIRHCHEHNPKERWTSSQLQKDQFVKIYTDEEADS